VTHPLDDPVRGSLIGDHAHLAQRRGNILRYPPQISPFISIHEDMTSQDWADVAALVQDDSDGASPAAAVFACVLAPAPEGWSEVWRGEGYQLVGEDVTPQPDEEAVRLGPADIADMLALVARTEPGPFAPHTIELGTYLGIRRGGALVAMAGERFSPPGWVEVSAVCTDPAYRGQGLAGRLIRAVAADIRSRDAIPFLHVTQVNTGARRLYDALGFRQRRVVEFAAILPPDPKE
jgi:predicted GNAT family acetyltransferase